MNLYFQFLSQNQTPQAIRLIELLGFFLPDKRWSGRLKVSSEGVISSSKFQKIEKVIEARAKKQFNQLEIIVECQDLVLELFSSRILSLNGVFTPSPSCALWRATRSWSMAVDGTVGNRWMNAKNRESNLSTYNISQMPSIFEMVIELNTLNSPNEILRACAERLVEKMNEDIAIIQPFGCCDVGGSEFFVRIEANVIMTDAIRVMRNVHPSGFAELGNRFEATHSLMFGSKQICHEIKSSFGEQAKLFTGDGVGVFGAILLDETCKCDLAKKAKAVWLVSNPDVRL